MLHLPVLRWGAPYDSLEKDEVVHFSTGEPIATVSRANMKKNGFVLAEMRKILDSLTRGLSLDVLSSGYGEERGVPISFQVQSPVVGLVLPSNSPGVHTLWLPIIPLQIGLVLKPGPCAWTLGLPRYRSTVGWPPKIRLRPHASSTAAPTSPSPG